MKNFEMAIVCSIFPAPILVKRPNFPGSPFVATSCLDHNKPEIIVVTPQLEPYWMAGKRLHNRWGADEVANDIQQEAGRLVHGVSPQRQALPGIWVSEGARPYEKGQNYGDGVIVKGEYSQTIKGNVEVIKGNYWIPQSEIDFHRVRQDRMGQNILDMMDILHRDGKDIAMQTLENMRPVANIFARWHNITGRDWQGTSNSTKFTECPKCEAKVSGTAMKCQHCGAVIDAERYYRALAEERLIMAKFFNDPDAELPPPAARLQTPKQQKAAAAKEGAETKETVAV